MNFGTGQREISTQLMAKFYVSANATKKVLDMIMSCQAFSVGITGLAGW